MFQIADNKFEVFGTVLLLLALFVSWFVHLPQKFGWNFSVVGQEEEAGGRSLEVFWDNICLSEVALT